ncbi:MAG: ferredoxin [Candidatus Dojkabacteria bacterium]
MKETTKKKTNDNALNPKSAAAVVAELKKDGVTVEQISPGIYQATSEKSNYIIEYDRSKCIGAASCSAIAPFTFFMDDENKAMFVENGIEVDDDETILAGAQSCPVLAIKILDKFTREVLFPVE